MVVRTAGLAGGEAVGEGEWRAGCKVGMDVAGAAAELLGSAQTVAPAG